MHEERETGEDDVILGIVVSQSDKYIKENYETVFTLFIESLWSCLRNNNNCSTSKLHVIYGFMSFIRTEGLFWFSSSDGRLVR